MKPAALPNSAGERFCLYCDGQEQAREYKKVKPIC